MRRIVLVSLFALLVSGASAQGRGGGARGIARGGIAFRPAFSGGHGYGSLPVSRGYGRLPNNYGYLAGGYGYGYAGDDTAPYDAVGGYAYVPQPMYLDPSSAPPPAIQVETKPAHPVLTNYTWPVASAPNGAVVAEGQTQTFGIVLKDGSTLAATTIVAADDVLHYVDPDERHMRVSMSAVDRAATLKLNRERKLTLYLPASPQ
jgi:hypothetical protein